MTERILDSVAWFVSALVLLAVVYVLSAPPVMIAMAKSSGGHVSSLYLPVVAMIESDFNGPVLWYFNDVWGCGIELMGDDSAPWYVWPCYALVGLGGIGALVLPFWRRRRRIGALGCRALRSTPTAAPP